jgi:hypothetical protein
MDPTIELVLGGNPVRFTSDGMVFIEDAIKALASEDEYEPACLWDRMKKDHPGILIHCGAYITKEGNSIQTVDIEGMDMIYRLLLEYI